VAGPAAATTDVEDVDGGHLGVLSGFLAAATTGVEDVDGGPWGVLAAGPAVAATDGEDTDGRPPGGCCQDFQQRPPSKFETSMVGPLGGAGGRSSSGHHRW
jgi:hypothetical protein